MTAVQAAAAVPETVLLRTAAAVQEAEQQPAAAAVPETVEILRTVAEAIPQAAVLRAEEVLQAAAAVRLPMTRLQEILLWTGHIPSLDFHISGERPGQTALTVQDW